MLYTITFLYSFYLTDDAASIYFNIGTLLFFVAVVLLLKMGNGSSVTLMMNY